MYTPCIASFPSLGIRCIRLATSVCGTHVSVDAQDPGVQNADRTFAWKAVERLSISLFLRSPLFFLSSPLHAGITKVPTETVGIGSFETLAETFARKPPRWWPSRAPREGLKPAVAAEKLKNAAPLFPLGARKIKPCGSRHLYWPTIIRCIIWPVFSDNRRVKK